MSVYCVEVNIVTNGEVDIVDITSDVKDVISKSKIKDGIVCVFFLDPQVLSLQSSTNRV